MSNLNRQIMAVFFIYTFKYIPWEEIRKIKNSDTYGISGIIAEKMNKANVLMAVSEDAQTMALIYKGEAIAFGTGKSIKETLKNIFTYARKEKEIVAHLDELADYLKVMPKNGEITFNKGAYNFKDLITGELVGFVEIIDNCLAFAIFRKGLKTEITGQQVFNSLIKYLKLNKVEFKGILGIWGRDSDTTLVFNSSISKGMSNEKSAFETWTGKRALEQGFNKVKVEKLIP
jgi:hypothetical protein